MLANYFNKLNKKIFESKGSDPLKIETSPYRDWKILIIVFFVSIAVSVGFNIYMLVQINNDNFFSSGAQQQSGPLLNRDGLTAVLTQLAAKEAIVSGKATTTTSLVDPSR